MRAKTNSKKSISEFPDANHVWKSSHIYMCTLKARLHYKTELNSTVVADKDQGPKTSPSLGLGLEYTYSVAGSKTAVLDPATL